MKPPISILAHGMSLARKSGSLLHPRNLFQGFYDMDKLVAASPNLADHIVPADRSRGGRATVRIFLCYEYLS